MEKTITFKNGKAITFKATAGTLRRYREQFGHDYIMDSLSISETLQNNNFSKEYFEMIENLVWAMAKTADNSTPEPEIFFDNFEVDEMSTQFMQDEILPIMLANYETVTKN